MVHLLTHGVPCLGLCFSIISWISVIMKSLTFLSTLHPLSVRFRAGDSFLPLIFLILDTLHYLSRWPRIPIWPRPAPQPGNHHTSAPWAPNNRRRLQQREEGTDQPRLFDHPSFLLAQPPNGIAHAFDVCHSEPQLVLHGSRALCWVDRSCTHPFFVFCLSCGNVLAWIYQCRCLFDGLNLRDGAM